MILVLDNFEVLAKSPRRDSSFFAVLRSLHGNYRVVYLVASLFPLHELEQVKPAASPFFNMFLPVVGASDPLGPMDPQESQNLVVELMALGGVQVSEPVVECILELGKNRPYLLKRAGRIAFRLWQNRGHIEPAQHCKLIRKRFSQDERSTTTSANQTLDPERHGQS